MKTNNQDRQISWLWVVVIFVIVCALVAPWPGHHGTNAPSGVPEATPKTVRSAPLTSPTSVFKLQKGGTMSIKRVAGAGDTTYNGDYSGPEPKGPWVYSGTGGSRSLYFDTIANTFILNSSVANSGRGAYNQGFGTNAADPSTATQAWSTDLGTGPAPTVAAAPITDPLIASHRRPVMAS